MKCAFSAVNYYKPAYACGGPVRWMSLQFEALVSPGAKVMVLTTNANGREQLENGHIRDK